jgi:hypothetical protein
MQHLRFLCTTFRHLRWLKPMWHESFRNPGRVTLTRSADQLLCIAGMLATGRECGR